jgi:hypothetical protein
LKVFLTNWWEEFKPVKGFLEFRNFALLDTNLHKDLVLGWWYLNDCWGSCFFVSFSAFASLLFLGFWGWGWWSGLWLLGPGLATFDLHFESICGSLDWHSCAMESEWEKSILSSLLLISHLEFCL